MNNWNELESELLERLGFCGCGAPDEALLLIHDLLVHFENHRAINYTGSFEGAEWEKYCKDEKESLNKVLDDNKEGIKYALFYLLDDKGITNHGSSVPGWVEDTEFMDKLKLYVKKLALEAEE